MKSRDSNEKVGEFPEENSSSQSFWDCIDRPQNYYIEAPLTETDLLADVGNDGFRIRESFLYGLRMVFGLWRESPFEGRLDLESRRSSSPSSRTLKNFI